jgi:hypothetical protein
MVKTPFTTIENNNKITTKCMMGFSKLGRTLNTFQHRDDASTTQKNFNIVK